ncbi:MAG: TRAP transporter small permease subunit [Rhizobiales bacterium]|nr:TRAP transporter small permease subunit [Hyphomicrobiales bacterium]
MSGPDKFSDELIAERRSGAPGALPADMAPWMARTITAIDTIVSWSGRIVAFILVPIMLSMVYEVVARKLFLAPTMWAYDVSRMLCGAMFMLGAAYALLKGVHIRADFIYRGWSPRSQATVDAALYILLFFPAMWLFFDISYDYAARAWIRGERSMDTAFMAPVAPVRTAMPVGAALLMLQGVSELLKCFYAINRNRWPA